MSALVFGQDPPPEPVVEMAEVGWHPACYHVRHISIGPKLHLEYNTALIYGRIPRADAIARLGECDICRVPETAEIGL